MSSALKLSAQCNKLEQDISLSLSWQAVTVTRPCAQIKPDGVRIRTLFFSFLLHRVSGKLPAEISVSQDSSQRSLRVNCQSQTFLHCPGSFDRVQCLMPGSGFMMARWKPFDHWLHCVRDPKSHQDKLNLMIFWPCVFYFFWSMTSLSQAGGNWCWCCSRVWIFYKSSNLKLSTFSLGPPLVCLTLRKNLFQFSWRN